MLETVDRLIALLTESSANGSASNILIEAQILADQIKAARDKHDFDCPCCHSRYY